MVKDNNDIRIYLKESKVFVYEVAKELSMHENSLFRLLRYELSDDQKQTIIETVNRIKKRKE